MMSWSVPALLLGCSAVCAAEAQVQLACSTTTGNIKISWDPVPDAKWYDVQIGAPSAEEEYFAGQQAHANETQVTLKNLLPGEKYFFQLLALVSNSNGTSEWREMSKKKECTVPSVLRSTESPRRRGYFISQMIRQHPQEDGLNNHNAADAKGQAKNFHEGWFNSPCKMVLYNVAVKKDSLSGQTTPVGPHSEYYANYMSCDEHHGSYKCTEFDDDDCRILGMKGKCDKGRDLSKSKDHVGMGRVDGKDDGGRWYSLPKAGLDNGHWKRDDQSYLKANCHGGMSEQDIASAFKKSSKYMQLPEADISAFQAETVSTVAV